MLQTLPFDESTVEEPQRPESKKKIKEFEQRRKNMKSIVEGLESYGGIRVGREYG